MEIPELVTKAVDELIKAARATEAALRTREKVVEQLSTEGVDGAPVNDAEIARAFSAAIEARTDLSSELRRRIGVSVSTVRADKRTARARR